MGLTPRPGLTTVEVDACDDNAVAQDKAPGDDVAKNQDAHDRRHDALGVTQHLQSKELGRG